MKRYDVVMNTFEDGIHEEESMEGVWVKWKDFDALLFQCEEAIVAYMECPSAHPSKLINAALTAIRAARVTP
jgi:hypothetical protein